MAVKTKRKTTPRKMSPRRSGNDVSINEIGLECKRLLGWDPRITEYIIDPKELKAITDGDRGPYTVQHVGLVNQIDLLGYHLREIGALADNKGVNHRIVELTKLVSEPVAE